jgi:hypothetical protein
MGILDTIGYPKIPMLCHLPTWTHDISWHICPPEGQKAADFNSYHFGQLVSWGFSWVFGILRFSCYCHKFFSATNQSFSQMLGRFKSLKIIPTGCFFHVTVDVGFFHVNIVDVNIGGCHASWFWSSDAYHYSRIMLSDI